MTAQEQQETVQQEQHEEVRSLGSASTGQRV